MRPASFSIFFLSGLLYLTACERTAAPPDPTIEEVVAATEKYRDVEVAMADGYVRDFLDTCETPYHMGIIDGSGVMGIHYIRLDLLGIDDLGTRLDVTGTHTDFLRPAVLVYEPQADGSLELVALENLVSAAAWTAAGNRGSPSFQGIPYEYRPDDPGLMTLAQYDRHIWLRENPDGIFAQYNPNATCEHHVFDMPMIHPPDPHSEHQP